MKQGTVIDTVESTLKRHDMVPLSDAPIVLMVSGGSDSVASAFILTQLLPKSRFTILHINHQLRGEDADDDESFVIELARELELPCEVRRIDVAAKATESGGNIEQAGRIARYAAAEELLDRLCLLAGVDPTQGRIVTAHTLDDRVETFFMRVIVGAGAGALSSIPYLNGRVVRPLLDCERQQLREWLAQREGSYDQLWREDATNSDTSKLRAFIRQELIPSAMSRNPELLQTIANNLNNLTCDNRFLENITDELELRFVTYEDTSEGNIEIVKINSKLFKEDQALIRRLIQRVCKHLLPVDKRITSDHIVNIAENGDSVGFVTVISDAVTVENEYGTLIFRREDRAPEGVRDSWIVALTEDKPEVLPDGRTIELKRIAPDSYKGDPEVYVRDHASATRVFIDEAKILQAGGKLKLSHVQSGDRFCPLGMKGHHRLVHDVFIDRKVPRRLRSVIAKVSVGTGEETDIADEIVWVINVQLDDRFKVSETTTSMLSIIVHELNST